MNAVLRIGVVGILLYASNSSRADIILVPGTSNIFAAGSATIPFGAGDGTVPPVVSFAPGANLVVRFSSVTGSVSADTNAANLNGPDGGVYLGYAGTNINSAAGISGMVHANRNMFLAGVFLDSGTPVSAPARLGFSDPENFTSISPLIGQTFFIGDGLTDTGSIQQHFNVPNGANRLFLGFVDAADPIPFQGRPGFYFDNTGTLTANLSVAAIPEPNSIALALVASVVLLNRRKNSRYMV